MALALIGDWLDDLSGRRISEESIVALLLHGYGCPWSSLAHPDGPRGRAVAYSSFGGEVAEAS